MSLVQGKVALVTGGASGIGLAITKKLLDANVKGVGVVDFSNEYLTRAKASLEKYGQKVLLIRADVSKIEELKGAFDKTVEIFKNLDIVFNNAGIVDEKGWEKMVAINLNAVVNGTFFALNEYLPKFKSGEGIIINTASIQGINPVPSIPIYAATKHAVIGLAQSLTQQSIFKESNIRLFTICPGFVSTNIFNKHDEAALAQVSDELYQHVKEIITPECVANGVLSLISEAEHGSIWVLEEDLPYEVVVPRKVDMRRKSPEIQNNSQ